MENETINMMPDTGCNPEIKAPEKIGLGIIGALVGALLGGASIIAFSQLGYIASISGFILAFCTLKGYELLARGLSKKGVVLCALLMLITPFAADYLDWGIMAYQELKAYGATFSDCLMMLPDMLAEGVIPMGEYLKNLGMIYLFVIIGGFYTLKDALQK